MWKIKENGKKNKKKNPLRCTYVGKPKKFEF
jgi:hypothetical protein